MRIVLVCCLLGGCSLMDGVADSASTARSLNRIYIGGDTITISQREDMTRYTCGSLALVCDGAGAKWQCSCEYLSF